MDLKSFWENLDKKKLAAVAGVILLIAGFIWVAFNPFWVSEQVDTPEEIKRKTFREENVDYEIETVGGNEKYFYFNDERGFQIYYSEADDTFYLNILRSQYASLTQEEFQNEVVPEIEGVFINNVLELENREDACKLNVVVFSEAVRARSEVPDSEAAEEGSVDVSGPRALPEVRQPLSFCNQ